jgi:hypothetical protein
MEDGIVGTIEAIEQQGVGRAIGCVSVEPMGAPTMHEMAWEVFVPVYLAGEAFATRANRLHSGAKQHFRG